MRVLWSYLFWLNIDDVVNLESKSDTQFFEAMTLFWLDIDDVVNL